LSYVQFIKENSIQSDSPQIQHFKPDFKLQQTVIRLFDPKATRASSKGPLARAETVCATHLYAYLQDQQELPVLQQERNINCVDDNDMPLNPSIVRKIFESLDSIEKPALSDICTKNNGDSDGIVPGSSSHDVSRRITELMDDQSFTRRSLVSQAKVMSCHIILLFVIHYYYNYCSFLFAYMIGTKRSF